MRIARGNEVIGEYSAFQVKTRIEGGSLLHTDVYYDEDSSEWLPLAGFLMKKGAVKADKVFLRPCYCGSGLPFHNCHGDGSQY